MDRREVAGRDAKALTEAELERVAGGFASTEHGSIGGGSLEAALAQGTTRGATGIHTVAEAAIDANCLARRHRSPRKDGVRVVQCPSESPVPKRKLKCSTIPTPKPWPRACQSIRSGVSYCSERWQH
jgi:hypothetical protein